jgi:hypothetical protein
MPVYGGYSVSCRPLGTNGSFGPLADTTQAFTQPSTAFIPFVDGSKQLKQNLVFALEAADGNGPFEFMIPVSQYPIPPTYIFPRNYAYASYHFPLDFGSSLYIDSFLDEFKPFEDNYFLRNFVYSPTNMNSDGSLGSGVYYDPSVIPFSLPPIQIPSSVPFSFPEYAYVTGGNTNLLTPQLSTTNAQWIYSACQPPDTAQGNIGIDDPLPYDTLYLPNGQENIFGLAYQSARRLYKQGVTLHDDLLAAGGNIPDTNNAPEFFYAQVAPPQLQTVGYFFGVPNRDYLPGHAGFDPANTVPPLIASVGQSFALSGWARQTVNSNDTKLAYLEQYFDRAYKIDAIGNVTTNQTGLLSPYGEFFPTDPGLVALLTMPDIDTGQRGTGVVNVIKLQTDVDLNGQMDLSFAGPDNTSQARPFQWWINDVSDQMTFTGDPGHEVEDFGFSPDYKSPFIVSRRDLENYARLWICGVPVLPTGQGYTVTLGMSAVSGNPAINLVDAVETNGGTLYLSDTDVAGVELQRDYGLLRMKYPTIAPTNTFTLPANLFTNAGNKYFLFEGAGIGEGQLTLTISQGSNVLAQTSMWLDLHDVKDFYEQAYATNVTSGKPPSSLVSQFSVIKTASVAPDETKQVIVFVHGINNTVSSYESTSRTIFKRLRQSGYRGRFASFRWPCAYLPWNTANPFQYNLGEFYAFKSATALKNYLSYLRNRPDLAGYAIDLYAHSQGNVVASEAVLQGAPFDNYILAQGAFPAHCYDTNAPFLQKLLDAETNSVNAVQTPFYPVNGGYHGYCSTIHGNLLDFYNTNDFALATGTTLGLQTNWEEDQRAQKPEAFLGGPSYVYDPATFITKGYYTFGSSYTVTDLQEIKALVARSRSKAVGAQGGLHGAISGSVDLFGTFGFGLTRSEHSAQFDRPIQTSKSYWDEVVRTFNPATP